MTFTRDEFRRSLDSDQPPAGLGQPVAGLWWDAKGDWDKAHRCVDDREDEAGIRVHAYLHRKEGDLGNAAYWYRRIGRATPGVSLAEEHEMLLRELLAGDVNR